MDKNLELLCRNARNLEYDVDGDGKYWRKLRSSDILQLFKLGGARGSGPVHPDAQGASWIGDTCVFIVPSRKSPHWNDRLPGAKVGRRVVALCNRCNRFVCPGHLDQHRRGRACVEAA